MKKFVAGMLGGIFGMVLAGASGYWYLHYQSTAKPVDVYPATLNTKPSVELADLILDIMGQEKEGWWWNWQADSNIVWEDGISYGSEISSRAGSVRVNVLGKTLTVLKDHEKELGWSIALKSIDMPAKFGPDTIELAPDGCFGTGYEGCAFDPLASLDKKGISHNTACKVFTGGGGSLNTYTLHFPHKADVVMTVAYNAGSGGDNNELQFQKGGFAEAAKICGKNIEYSLSYMDKNASLEQPSESTEKYSDLSEDVLKKLQVGEGFEGKSCLVYLIADGTGNVIDTFSDEKYGYEPLCSKAIEGLNDIKYPAPKDGKPISWCAGISR